MGTGGTSQQQQYSYYFRFVPPIVISLEGSEQREKERSYSLLKVVRCARTKKTKASKKEGKGERDG